MSLLNSLSDDQYIVKSIDTGDELVGQQGKFVKVASPYMRTWELEIIDGDHLRIDEQPMDKEKGEH